MNLGLGELLAVILNIVLLAAIPAVVVLFIVMGVRRLRELESRIAKLEQMIGKADSPRRDT